MLLDVALKTVFGLSCLERRPVIDSHFHRIHRVSEFTTHMGWHLFVTRFTQKESALSLPMENGVTFLKETDPTEAVFTTASLLAVDAGLDVWTVRTALDPNWIYH
jgi:hypothetical protein